jgi:hypothetical protein
MRGQRRVEVVGRVDPARRDGHAGRGHPVPGIDLVAHGLDRVGVRTHPDQPGRPDGPGELGVLRQEPVPGVDRLGPGRLGRGQHCRLVPVRLGRVGRSDQDRLVRLGHERQTGVGLRVDGDGAHTQLPGGADDAAGDLPAVGDEQRLKHVGGSPDDLER